MEAIKVNLIPNGIPQTCHASQYDEGRQIRLDLFDGFTPYVIKSGDTFTLNVRKPDNHVIVETITGTEGNTYLVIETTEQMTAVMGKNLCEIRVENDGDNIGSLNFIMEVEKDVIANGIPSESVIEDLDALVAEAVGDDFYTKSETDDKITALIDDESTASDKTWSSEKIDETVDSALSNKYENKLTQTLKVGENILTEPSVVLGANWSGTLESGISHSSGSTDSLEFNIPTTNGKAYLVTFDATGVNNTTALNVKIGDLPLVDVYTGRTDFVVGFISDGGNLVFTPQSNYSGTITNLKLREVTDEGDEVTFTVKNVTTKADNSGVSGFWNVALGFSSFENNINGSRNVAVGFESLQAFQSGTRNLALGTYAMNRLESGERNIAVGADSMWFAKVANDCIAFGHNSMSGVGTDLANNVAIGRDTLGVITTGKNNVAIGFQALVSPQNNNMLNATAIGANAGNYGNTYGTYIGSRAGYFMKGISNTCIGYGSGAQQNASGARNTFIGATCGIDNTGATAQNPKNVDDSIVIGYQARATKSNQMMLGSTDINEVVMCGNKKIIFNNDGSVTWETLT